MINVSDECIVMTENIIRDTADALKKANELLQRAATALQSGGRDKKSQELLEEISSKRTIIVDMTGKLQRTSNALAGLYHSICEYIKDNG